MNQKLSTVAKISAFAVIGSLFLLAAGCNKSETQPTGGTQQERAAQQEAPAQKLPEEIRLDYANWNPVSLILHEHGFLEDEFKKDNVKITWAFSQGSNKSMEFLLSGSVDFAASAGMAAMVSFINGNPITTLSMTNTSEPTLMVRSDSDIKEVADIKSKTVAVTPGTDPYLFLVRALSTANLTINDIELVNLQHADGRNALLREQVDVWAGLDPLQSESELEGSAKYLYRNIDFSTHVVLSVNNDFLKNYPDVVVRVLSAHEKARQWAKDNPDEYLALVARQAKIPPEVAKLMLEKYSIEVGEITDTLIQALIETGAELKRTGVIKEEVDIQDVLNRLIDKSYFEKVGK